MTRRADWFERQADSARADYNALPDWQKANRGLPMSVEPDESELATLRAEVQRLQSQNCELESILAAIAVAKSGEVSDFMESFGIVRDIRDLCLRAEAAEASLARVEAERDEMHRQLSEQAITLAGVEAARAALEAQVEKFSELADRRHDELFACHRESDALRQALAKAEAR